MLSKKTWRLVLLMLMALLAGCAQDDAAETPTSQQTADNDAEASLEQQIAASLFKEPAPDFTLLNTDGTEVTLDSLKGSPVVLNFWSTGCPYCIAEFEYFSKAQEDFPQIRFLAADTAEDKDLGDRGSREEIARFASGKGLAVPIVFDVGGEVYGTLYATQGLPSTFLIDAEGNARLLIVGAVKDYETLKTCLRVFLQETAGA